MSSIVRTTCLANCVTVICVLVTKSAPGTPVTFATHASGTGYPVSRFGLYNQRALPKSWSYSTRYLSTESATPSLGFRVCCQYYGSPSRIGPGCLIPRQYSRPPTPRGRVGNINTVHIRQVSIYIRIGRFPHFLLHACKQPTRTCLY